MSSDTRLPVTLSAAWVAHGTTFPKETLFWPTREGVWAYRAPNAERGEITLRDVTPGDAKAEEALLQDVWEDASAENIQRDLSDAVDEWFEKWSKNYRSIVHGRLDKAANGIVAKLLGFDPDYGADWRIDHCNGRKPIAAIYLKERAQSAVDSWLEKLCVDLPGPDPELLEGARKEYVEKFRGHLNKRVRERAEEQAEEAAERVAEELIELLIPGMPTAVKIADARRRLGEENDDASAT